MCGAPNIAAGQKIIVATHGARIAGGHKIKRGKLRGVESQGMICSLQEIGVPSNLVQKNMKMGFTSSQMTASKWEATPFMH